MTKSVQADANAEPRPVDVQVGYRLPEVRHRPTRLQLFQYGAVTWNSHRIHFDPDYAAQEGYPDVLVQSHLHGAFLVGVCTDWMGADGRLKKLGVSVKRFAVPGDVLICSGEVTGVEPGDDGFRIVHLSLVETRESDGSICATGNASVALPPDPSSD